MHIRSCNKSTAGTYPNTFCVCTTHGMAMDSSSSRCAVGALEELYSYQLNHLEQRLQTLEAKVTDRLAEFGKNLERLHHDDSGKKT